MSSVCSLTLLTLTERVCLMFTGHNLGQYKGFPLSGLYLGFMGSSSRSCLGIDL